MDSLETRIQTLAPATRKAVLALIEALLANPPAGPRLAPPPTRGRHRPAPGDLVSEDTPAAPALVLAASTWAPHQEAAVREALKERWPLVASARQVTAQLSLPHVQVRAILLDLARRGVFESPNEGYFRFVPLAQGATHV